MTKTRRLEEALRSKLQVAAQFHFAVAGLFASGEKLRRQATRTDRKSADNYCNCCLLVCKRLVSLRSRRKVASQRLVELNNLVLMNCASFAPSLFARDTFAATQTELEQFAQASRTFRTAPLDSIRFRAARKPNECFKSTCAGALRLPELNEFACTRLNPSGQISARLSSAQFGQPVAALSDVSFYLRKLS